MSRAEELLTTLDDDSVTYPSDTVEEYIIVNEDRSITVPESLRRLGVQHDHNIETVTIICPRFWDDHDMSDMTVYVNYLRPDGVKGQYPATNLKVSETSITFDWVISKNVTQVNGKLSFLICIVKVNEEGLEDQHWNSELNQECYITQGMECNEHIVLAYPDVITYILTKLEEGGAGTSGEPGAPGKDGKSAYEYAKEAGYTGTEEEFAEKLAADIPQGGGVSSWNDLTDKPFYDVDKTVVAELPASLEDHDIIDVNGSPYFVKITDEVVDWRTVMSGSLSYTLDGNSREIDISEAQIQEIDALTGVLLDDLIFYFVPAGNHVVEGITFTGGIWTLVEICGACTPAVLTLNVKGSIPLDEKYIPDTIARTSAIPNLDDIPSPNWAQNDPSGDGYIENRTHWSDKSELVVLSNTIADISLEDPLTGYWYTSSSPHMNMYYYMEDGGYYTVTFDRNSYICTCQTYQEVNNDITCNKWLLGNTDLIPSMGVTSLYPDLPFLFEVYTHSNSSGCNWSLLIPGPGPKEISIEVHKGIRKFNTIDQMYIPSTIARTANTLPMPPVAVVGQIIVVTEVDENGRVVATEAVDLPASSGQTAGMTFSSRSSGYLPTVYRGVGSSEFEIHHESSAIGTLQEV